MKLDAVVETSGKVAEVSGRNEKIKLLAGLLGGAGREALVSAIRGTEPRLIRFIRLDVSEETRDRAMINFGEHLEASVW